jgi:glutathione S-transferase
MTEPALDVWGLLSAANVQKVTWCLGELGLPFNARGVGYEASEPRDACYLKVRGGAASPILRDGAFVLWEGNAIARYLAQKYGDGTLYPDDLQRRADIDRWMDYQLSTIRPPLHALLRDDLAPAAVARHAKQLAETMEPVEAILKQQPYLCGETFTIGEIPVGITAYRWLLLDVPRPSSPAIEAWLDGLRARPAFAKAIVPPAATSIALRV